MKVGGYVAPIRPVVTTATVEERAWLVRLRTMIAVVCNYPKFTFWTVTAQRFHISCLEGHRSLGSRKSLL